MKTYSYSEAQQDLPAIFNRAVSEDIIIKRQDGARFKLVYLADKASTSPFSNIEGIAANITTQELVGIIREQREL